MSDVTCLSVTVSHADQFLFHVHAILLLLVISRDDCLYSENVLTLVNLNSNAFFNTTLLPGFKTKRLSLVIYV